jgi:hypothetical protein
MGATDRHGKPAVKRRAGDTVTVAGEKIGERTSPVALET